MSIRTKAVIIAFILVLTYIAGGVIEDSNEALAWAAGAGYLMYFIASRPRLN